jgi:hypothetical protein
VRLMPAPADSRCTALGPTPPLFLALRASRRHLMVVLQVRQGHPRLLPREPVCRVLGEQSLNDGLEWTGVQERCRFAFDDRDDGVEE